MFDKIKYELQKNNSITILVVINVALFFIINVSEHIFKFNLIPYLALPLNFQEFIIKPWTIVTYMFSHEGLGHVFYNMMLLYFTSKIFTNFLSEQKLVFVYLWSGVAGGLLLLLLGILLPSVFNGSFLVGASAATIGVVASLAFIIPELQIHLFGIFEMRYKYYALLIFVMFTIIDFTINTGGKISHFGGAFFGLFFGYLLKNGNDITKAITFKAKKKKHLKVVHKNESMSSRSSVPSNQATIDELLDKISTNGYENLSKEEKELLFKLSQKK